VSHTMLDLLIILIPHLPSAPATALFNAASTGNLIENSDAAIQKKSYRILTRLIELNKASVLQGEGFDQFVQKLVDVSASIGPGAQRVSRRGNSNDTELQQLTFRGKPGSDASPHHPRANLAQD
jgi:hypothetical protein